MKKYLLLIAILCSISISDILAQKAMTTPDEAQRFADMVTSSLSKGEVEKSMKMVKSNLDRKSMGKESAETIKELLRFMDTSKQEMGKSLGYDLAKEEKAGKYVLRYTYVVLYESQPVWIRYTYYGNTKNYNLKSIDFGKDMEELF